MDFSEFDKKLQAMARDAKSANGIPLSKEIEAAALRFVDDNFRSSSWEGVQWEKSSDDGTPLIQSGALKRSFNGESTPQQVRIYTNVPYARVHNEGYKGTESVKAHTRGVYTKKGRGKKVKSGVQQVRAFTRQMNIRQRQFAPYEGHESPTLNKEVEQIITDHVQNFFANHIK